MSKQEIYARFKSIEGDGLESHSLSLSDYQALNEVLQDVFAYGRAQTFIKAVADWCVRNVMMVTQTISGIHYIIRLEQ
jgi:hypothetical protein